MAPRLRLDHLRMPKVRMCTFITPRLTFKVSAARCMCMILSANAAACTPLLNALRQLNPTTGTESASAVRIATRLCGRGRAIMSIVCSAPLG